MKRIFKYPLPLEVQGPIANWKARAEIELPVGAEILSCAVQHGSPVMWAKVDPEAPKEKRGILVLNTGAELPDDNFPLFIGTLIFNDGGLVFHVFDDQKVPF